MRLRTVPIVVCFGALCALSAGCASRTTPRSLEAIQLYDDGRYREAQDLLEEIDAEGGASGALLYRLHYCQRANGDDGAEATLERAREQLETELPTSEGLEVPFYLVNAYQNLSRPDDANRVAAETTAAIDSGEAPEPENPLEMFRLGKLYADQGRAEPATRWYESAVAGFSAVDETSGPYVLWSSRYLAEPAFRRGDHEATALYYGMIAEAGEASAVDLDRLATAQYRLARYAEAGESWRLAALVEKNDPDRMRYCSSLALLVSNLSQLPTESPDGRAWDAFGKDELREFMIEQATRAKLAIDEANAPESLPNERKEELRLEVREAKPLFVAASVEYALKGYGIREAAFFGGFSPMVFHKSRWRMGTRSGRKGKLAKEHP
jgi:hypothetical protein